MPASADDGAEMVVIPVGSFWMGSEAGRVDERPRHRIELQSYAIDTYEVTNERFARFVAGGGYTNATFWSPDGWAWRMQWHVTQPAYWANPRWNGPRQPVVGVSWYEAEAYGRFAGKRLPTEAEWERAARGDDERVYPWGNDWKATNANTGAGQTVPVGSYPLGVSPFGVHDLAGNAWEWVADWYDRAYYASSPSSDPPGPLSGTEKVFRGGSWYSSRPETVTSSYREHTNGYVFNIRDEMTGFRCAKDVAAPSGSVQRR